METQELIKELDPTYRKCCCCKRLIHEGKMNSSMFQNLYQCLDIEACQRYAEEHGIRPKLLGSDAVGYYYRQRDKKKCKRSK